MKKVFVVLIICIFSLCISGSYVLNERDLYKELYNSMEFCDSGIKISYRTEEDIDEILKEINKLDLFYLDNTLQIDSNGQANFSFEKDTQNSSVNILIGKGTSGYNVEIEIIDKEKLVDIEMIKSKFSRLNNAMNLKYFSFIKVKTENRCKYELEKELFNILNCYNIENKSNVLLENGLTGIFTAEKTLKINYSIMNYNDGTYLIMGSPIIFITY